MTTSQLQSRLLLVLSFGGCTVSPVRDVAQSDPARAVEPVQDVDPERDALPEEPTPVPNPSRLFLDVLDGPYVLGDLAVMVMDDRPGQVTVFAGLAMGSSEVLGLQTELEDPMVLGQASGGTETVLRAALELSLEAGDEVYLQAVSANGASEVRVVSAQAFPRVCGDAPQHKLSERMMVCDEDALAGLCPSVAEAVLDTAVIRAVGPIPLGTTVTATCFEHHATASCCYEVEVVQPTTEGPLDTGILWEAGRPFRVAGERRQSAVSERTPAIDPIAEKVAATWTRMAQEEHASVAAFARFSLELMQLGAPMDLLAACCRAQQEEMVHTELTLAMASRMAGQPVELGALSMDGALADRDLAAVTLDVVREGCINETVSTLLAMDARDGATDPMAREALTRIADDEARHAELSWRFVRWALDQDPTLRPAVLAELRAFLPDVTAEPSPDADALAVYGVLDRRRVQAAAVRASRVIAACSATLS